MVRAVSAVQIDLGADGLTGRPVPLHHLPPVGQRLDEDEAAAVFVEGVRRRYVAGFRRVGLRTGVTDLDTDAACREGHPQLEVPAGDPAVGDRVGGQLGDDHGDGVGGRTAVRDAPGVQLVQSEVPGEAGAAGSGTEALGERYWHALNLAAVRGSSPDGRRVRCGSVRGYGLDSTRD